MSRYALQFTCSNRLLTMLQIIGDALVGVCFVRNLFATIISTSLTYWIDGEFAFNVHPAMTNR